MIRPAIPKRRFLDLRTRAAETLGDALELRAFRQAVLEHGSLPMSVPGGRVNRWIGAAR